MFKYAQLNNISSLGTSRFDANFVKTDNVEEANGILVRSAKMNDMEFSDSLLAIARAGAGVNNIPIDRCAEQGIVVFNTPGANANGVKELVLTGMLLASRDIVDGINWVKENQDDADIAAHVEKEKKKFAGTEIAGKKLGVIGLGAIGVQVANAAVNLDMEVYGYDPYLSIEGAWKLNRNVVYVKDLDEIYENCDFITIHVPAMDSTKNYISKEAIDKMKQGVIVVNMARSVLVDEKAMMAALDEGKVRRYVSDFPNPTIAGHKGCIITPHLGASTEESETNCAIMAVDELQDYLENGNIRNSVNFPSCDVGVCKAKRRIMLFHKNVANMITNFTTIMGKAKINIAAMTNKSKGDMAYTIIDLDEDIPSLVMDDLAKVEGVVRIREIQ